ncbi:MAG: hypothetical protein ACREXW_08035 [Gammaproteobacteria bacterium]
MALPAAGSLLRGAAERATGWCRVPGFMPAGFRYAGGEAPILPLACVVRGFGHVTHLDRNRTRLVHELRTERHPCDWFRRRRR